MYDETLAQRVRDAIGPEAVERKMFGGLTFLIGGNMACGVVKDDLFVRTGPEHFQDALARPHARPADFTGRPMTGMVTVDARPLDEAALTEWVLMGRAFAASLPPK